MAEAGPGDAGGYVAFISYSHKDAAMGRWLHRRLEGYKLPKRLAGTQGEHGEVPARLTPIFRDRDELPAAGDLSEKVRAALAISRNLIVVCSPSSAVSPWVAKEIATFRELHPDRPILTAIVAGEPDQCFAPILREGGTEPLAADLREEGDGRRLGLLKLVAGLSGVGLDDLVQRDAARRVRLVTFVTAAALAAMLLMALLSVFAFNARTEAIRQRAEAEGLVEFMFTDLRDSVRELGRLEVLEPINQRALSYYALQGDLADLPDVSQARRAGILHAIGEDEELRGNAHRAFARFTEAHAATARAVSRHPRNIDALYYHAQSEFWMGYMAYLKKDWPRTARHWRAYKTLADRMLAIDPAGARSLREVAYAQGNLCTLALSMTADPRQTLLACQAGLSSMERLHRAKPHDRKTIQDLANRHAWVGGAWLAAGSREQAAASLKAQERLLEPLVQKFPDDARLQDQWMRGLMSLAEVYADIGRRDDAHLYNTRARAIADRLIALDPLNSRWRAWLARIDKNSRRIGNAS